MPDLIRRVSFTASAAQRWRAIAEHVALAIRANGIAVEAVPFEAAELLPDGRLLVYVDPPAPLDGVRYGMVCAPDEWFFAPLGNVSAN